MGSMSSDSPRSGWRRRLPRGSRLLIALLVVILAVFVATALVAALGAALGHGGSPPPAGR